MTAIMFCLLFDLILQQAEEQGTQNNLIQEIDEDPIPEVMMYYNNNNNIQITN